MIAQRLIEEPRYIVDEETGEILGYEGVEQFVVDTAEKADWVLGKMLAEDAEIASIQSSSIVLQAKAILENAEKMVRDHQRKREWLETRFGPELAEFARRELAGQKSRTWKGLYGSVSLRTKPGGLRVADPDRALSFAREHCPEFIKRTEEFQISRLKQDAAYEVELRQSLEEGYEPAVAAFWIAPDEETISIKTGVSK